MIDDHLHEQSTSPADGQAERRRAERRQVYWAPHLLGVPFDRRVVVRERRRPVQSGEGRTVDVDVDELLERD